MIVDCDSDHDHSALLRRRAIQQESRVLAGVLQVFFGLLEILNDLKTIKHSTISLSSFLFAAHVSN